VNGLTDEADRQWSDGNPPVIRRACLLEHEESGLLELIINIGGTAVYSVLWLVIAIGFFIAPEVK